MAEAASREAQHREHIARLGPTWPH
jgi:hypothetical protein